MSKSKADLENELVLAYLQNQRIEALEAYLKRGRQYADIDDQELNRRWIAAFKIWAAAAAAGVQSGHRERLDLDSEIALRGREAPFESVTEECRVLQAVAKAQVSNPSIRESLENAAKEILEFEKSGRKKPPN
jgi:hypothetical protein